MILFHITSICVELELLNAVVRHSRLPTVPISVELGHSGCTIQQRSMLKKQNLIVVIINVNTVSSAASLIDDFSAACSVKDI